MSKPLDPYLKTLLGKPFIYQDNKIKISEDFFFHWTTPECVPLILADTKLKSWFSIFTGNDLEDSDDLDNVVYAVSGRLGLKNEPVQKSDSKSRVILFETEVCPGECDSNQVIWYGPHFPVFKTVREIPSREALRVLEENERRLSYQDFFDYIT